MATDVIPNRAIHDEFKTSAFFKTPIQEEDEDNDGVEKELNETSSGNELDSSTIEVDDSDSESEPEDKHDDIFKNGDVLLEKVRLLRLASQEPDDIILQNVKEYRRNFDGFAEIVPFDSISAMHEYIQMNLKNRKWEKYEDPKQERYLNILLRVQPEDRFNKLLDSSDSIVRRILLANRVILEDLLKIANIEKFPCPFASDTEDSEEFESRDDEDDVEATIKPWYMLELIGMWLNFVNNPQSFRNELKSALLEKRLGGIPVPLKFI